MGVTNPMGSARDIGDDEYSNTGAGANTVGDSSKASGGGGGCFMAVMGR